MIIINIKTQVKTHKINIILYLEQGKNLHTTRNGFPMDFVCAASVVSECLDGEHHVSNGIIKWLSVLQGIQILKGEKIEVKI